MKCDRQGKLHTRIGTLSEWNHGVHPADPAHASVLGDKTLIKPRYLADAVLCPHRWGAYVFWVHGVRGGMGWGGVTLGVEFACGKRRQRFKALAGP